MTKNKPLFPIWTHLFWFLMAALLVLGVLNGAKLLGFVPHSAHSWRQSDCASLSLNLWQDGFSFAPRVHNVIEGDGHTCAEFPFFYYLSAIWYPIFGDADWVMRGTTLLCWLSGLFAFSRLIWHFSDNRFWAIGLPMLLLSAPILVFYGINYLPNVPTLGLVFIGWLCYYYFYTTRKSSWLWAFQLVFLIAAMIKPTVLVSWAAIGLVQLIFDRRILGGGLSWAFVLAATIGWRVWVTDYNKIHHSTPFFLSKIMPIWKTDGEDRLRIWDMFATLWHKHIAFMGFHIAIILLTLSLTIHYFQKRKEKNASKRQIYWGGHLFLFSWLVLLGNLTYLSLWAIQLEHHDYYFIETFTFPAAILLWFSDFLKNKNNLQNIVNQGIIYFLFIVFLAFNVAHSNHIIWKVRYEKTNPFVKDAPMITSHKDELRHWLTTNGVAKSDTIATLPDGTPNHVLYFCNRVGVSRYNWGVGKGAPRVAWLRSLVRERGVKFLVITDLQDSACDSVRNALPKPISTFENSIFLYDLRNF